jgi:hypothetical protein
MKIEIVYVDGDPDEDNNINTRGADKSLSRIDNSYVKVKHLFCLSSL